MQRADRAIGARGRKLRRSLSRAFGVGRGTVDIDEEVTVEKKHHQSLDEIKLKLRIRDNDML